MTRSTRASRRSYGDVIQLMDRAFENGGAYMELSTEKEAMHIRDRCNAYRALDRRMHDGESVMDDFVIRQRRNTITIERRQMPRLLAFTTLDGRPIDLNARPRVWSEAHRAYALASDFPGDKNAESARRISALEAFYAGRGPDPLSVPVRGPLGLETSDGE